MRYFAVMTLVALPAVAACGQTTTNAPPDQPPPPPYSMMRFNENYAYLSNGLSRSDWFDPAKYIPLRSDDPSWYLTLGGGLRERFEGNYNLNFGIGSGADSYLLQRVTLLTDLHLGERVRVFVEGISALMEGEAPPAPGAQEDPIDLEFAFLDVVPYLADDKSLTIRAGRFGLSFGAGRLVDTRPPVNVDFRFDGTEAIYSSPQWEATAFVAQPARDTGHFDVADHTTTFWGLYVTHWFDQPHTLGVDLYYFGIHREDGLYATGAGDEHRHTLGTRQFGSLNRWDWNAEEAVQLGSFKNGSVLAWTASADGGYTFDMPGQPRLCVNGDVTSGNTNPHSGQLQTFDALYFKSGYFNDASLLRPENIIDAHPNLALRPSRNLSLDGGTDFFWRYSRNDAIYGVPGFIAIPALHTGSSFVGTAFDVNLNWQIGRHLTFQASYVYFLSGGYVRDAGGRNVNYISTTLNFLF